MSGMDSRPIPTVRQPASGPPAARQRTGAVALAPRRRGLTPLPLAILGLLLLAVLVFLAAGFIHRSPAGKRAATASAPPASAPASSPASPPASPPDSQPPPAAVAPEPPSPAPVSTPQAPAGNEPVALEPAQLPAYVDKPVHAQGDLVQSIAGIGPDGKLDDERFFVGTSPQHQILVDYEAPTSPPFTIAPGQRVSFNGVLRRYPGNGSLRLTGPAEREVAQLGYYVLVTDATQIQAG